jgi:hypothetical protein
VSISSSAGGAGGTARPTRNFWFGTSGIARMSAAVTANSERVDRIRESGG